MKTEINQGATRLSKPARNEKGQLLPGNSGNPKGRTPDTPEQKLKKEIAKKMKEEYAQEYLGRLAEALPEIAPILIAKAVGGDMQAIKEINDRVIGKPSDPNQGGNVVAVQVNVGDDRQKYE
jgi:hypothetical protein